MVSNIHSVKNEINIQLTVKKFSSGTLLFRRGDVCRYIYFINKGLLRIYYYSEDGKEITSWFAGEGTMITAVDSFFSHKPTNRFCEAVDDTTVYEINMSQLQLSLSDEIASKAFINLFEVTIKMTELVDALKTKSAEDRYRLLINKYPKILVIVPLGQIASYLGVTQETLSRIRRKVRF